MADNDEICRLMAENGNMKQLLCELLPELEKRGKGKYVLIELKRNEAHVRKIKEFIADFECQGRG